MTTLSIGRLSATVHAGADDERTGQRVATMLEHLAQRRLDEALRATALPPGEWYVRRLDVTLVVDEERPGAAVETQWAAALLDALRRALAVASPDVVHHPHPVDALADLISELASGRAGRAWAWRRSGLLHPHDPAPESAPPEAVVAAARRKPELVSAALVAAVRAVGLPALHRLLGARGWRELATIVRAAVGGPASLPSAMAPSPLPEKGDAEGVPIPQVGTTGAARVPDGGGSPPSTDTAADVVGRALRSRGSRDLAAAVLTRSVLATEFRRARIRPGMELALAWAVLAVAEADPALLARIGADDVLRHLAAVLAGRATAAPSAAVRPAAGPPVDSSRAQVRPASSHPGDPAVVPAESAALDRAGGAAGAEDDGAPTGWAGLLFLLATAEEASIPGALLDDPLLGGRPMRWILVALALRLLPAGSTGPAADDPAVLAFAGLVPSARRPEGRPPLPAEATSLDGHAARWAVTTAQRLGRDDDDPAVVVAELARRRGMVVAVPGWIEVHLPVDEVDIDIRRAGLDLDPGWVPWLGAVVRYVYV